VNVFPPPFVFPANGLDNKLDPQGGMAREHDFFEWRIDWTPRSALRKSDGLETRRDWRLDRRPTPTARRLREPLLWSGTPVAS
jgi:hypothetical protein